MAQKQAEQTAPSPFVGMPLMGQQGPAQAGAQATPQQTVISNYLGLGTSLPPQLERIRRDFQALGPNPTQAQVETALTQLYNALRVGGTLGLAYVPDAGREPRGPSAVLQRRSGDCDELATAFLAAATRIGIPLAGARFAGIDFNTGAPGAASTVPHAVLFVAVNGHNYIFDMTRAAPTSVPDFSEATVSGQYRGRSISYGPDASSPNLTGIGRMVVLPTVADVVASQLLIRADYFDTQAQAGTTSAARAAALAQAIPLLTAAAALGSSAPFITAGLQRVARNVFDRVEALAESEHDAKRHAGAITQYRAALSLLQDIPALRADRGTREFDIRKSLADACRQSGRLDDALAEYDAMMRLRPADREAYGLAYELNISRFKSARTRPERQTHLTRAYVVLRVAENSASLDASTRAKFASQRAAVERELRRLGVDLATITIPPSP
ncbi:bacterial transcriptional activator domain-containing protein [Candidatus Micrarchaeota archaeon]|nr:bacterial transcriptional activator domain-containing protein [Candidatus Micrarchaeota archaeon]